MRTIEQKLKSWAYDLFTCLCQFVAVILFFMTVLFFIVLFFGGNN